MEELQLALTSARIDQRNFGLWINNWQIGQTLNALVTGQRPGGEIVLRVAGQQITATADIPVQQGAQLLLEVKQLRPVPTLRVLNPAPEAGAARLSGTLQLLPTGMAGVASPPLASVAQALQTAQSTLALPGAVTEALSLLLRQIARPDRLTRPDGLEQTMRQSGLLLESNLQATARSAAPLPEGDFKAGLFRALGRVDAALAQVEALSLPPADVESLLAMKRELEGALGRVTLHQLNSLPGEAPGSRHWQLEIPVQLAGGFHSLRIELEQERPGDGKSAQQGDDEQWRLNLELAPPAIGAVRIRLELRGDALRADFAAARSEVRSLIDAGMPALVSALQSRGISLTAGPAATLERSAAAAVDADRQHSSVDLRA